MAQEFNILRCYNCDLFQVHFVKKDTKWTCKVCFEKQSLKHVFFRWIFSFGGVNICYYHLQSCRGVAGHCRKHVQDLNMKRGKLYEEAVGKAEEEEDEEPDYGEFPPEVVPMKIREKKPGPDVNSRWYKYT